MPNLTRLTRAGVAVQVRALLDAVELDGLGEILGSLAVTTAACADRARIAGDPAGFLRASRELERLLDRVLPTAGGGECLDPADEFRSDESDGLAALLGARPKVRDASDA